MPTDGLIIIGASLAGARAAEGARDAGWEGPIRLIGAEAHLPYQRPPLSKGVLLGQQGPSAAHALADDYYALHDVDLILGTPVTDLDLQARTVGVGGTKQLRFDKVILATGSTARRLSIPGADLPQVHYLRTVDETLVLREALQPGRRVAVIGASWIGTEVAAVARQRGADVVLIGPDTSPLQNVLGREVGGYFADLHRSHGVDLRMQTTAEAIVGTDRVTGVSLADGTTIEADLVVAGIGVTPNIDVARRAGLATNQGVLVDAWLRTDHPDVLAAGDLAEADHPTFGGRVRVEHWANALNQGRVAGLNAANRHVIYDRVPYFFSDQYDMGLEHSGWPCPWERVVFRGSPGSGAFVAFYLAGDRVVAGANVNVWDVNEHVVRVLRADGPVDLDHLTDPDVDPATWCRHGSAITTHT